MKAKTIQIWFQNRRSKSRTKERQAAARRAEEGADVESSGSGGDGKSDTAADQAGVAAMEAKRIEVQLEDLRCLVRDGQSPFLLMRSESSIQGSSSV